MTYWYVVSLMGNTQRSNGFRTKLNRFPYKDFRKTLPKEAMLLHWIKINKAIWNEMKELDKED